MLESQPELSNTSIDLITVVFDKEIDLLKIQARSVSLYVSAGLIKNIYIVINDLPEVAKLIDASWWGTHSSKVKIINRPNYNKTVLLGWESQQLCKLVAAAECQSPWSLCLDAKTWFVNEFRLDYFFDPNGKVRYKWLPVIPVFAPASAALEKFFHIQMLDVIGPGGVPFAFRTSTVKSMIDFIEFSTSTNFVDFFTQEVRWPNQITEFMLYSAYVKKVNGNYAYWYNPDQHYSIVNLAHNESTHFSQKFAEMQRPNTLTASIHRDAYLHLTSDQIHHWAEFLYSKKLISHVKNFEKTINTFVNAQVIYD